MLESTTLAPRVLNKAEGKETIRVPVRVHERGSGTRCGCVVVNWRFLPKSILSFIDRRGQARTNLATPKELDVRFVLFFKDCLRIMFSECCRRLGLTDANHLGWHMGAYNALITLNLALSSPYAAHDW